MVALDAPAHTRVGRLQTGHLTARGVAAVALRFTYGAPRRPVTWRAWLGRERMELEVLGLSEVLM